MKDEMDTGAGAALVSHDAGNIAETEFGMFTGKHRGCASQQLCRRVSEEYSEDTILQRNQALEKAF